MKQFSLGEYLKNPQKKVITREGFSVRIICTDKVCNKEVSQKPIIALVDFGDREVVYPYSSDGISSPSLTEFDLFFAPTKKEGWVNVYDSQIAGGRCSSYSIFPNESKARHAVENEQTYVATCKIEWEE